MKVMKVISLFTGVEGVGMICSVLRMKFVAIWLEAVGVGLFSIFNSTLETATYLTSLGIRQSAVRDISLASRQGEGILRRVIARVRTWSVVAGILGCAVLSAGAWPLAQIIFEDGGMWWTFMILAGAMLFNALYAGESAIFQGTEAFRRLAKVGVWSAVTGLILSIPMYRFLGYASVPLSITVYALSGLIFALIFRESRFSREKVSRAVLKEDRTFIKFGAWLSVTAFINSLCQLAFTSWLNLTASTVEVGLYSAGITILIRYTSLVFNSVGLEFYPRISANTTRPKRMEIFLNHEISLLLLLFTPLVLLFLIFRGLVIEILYTREFLAVIPFVTIGIVVVILRAVSNTTAYVIMAKGDGKIYLLTESLDAAMGFGLNVWFYNHFGLMGMGPALVIWHFLYMIAVTLICRFRYGMRLNRGASRRTVGSLLTVGVIIAGIYLLPGYIWIPAAILGTAVYSVSFYRFLRRRRKSRTPLSQKRQ